ncbi:rRNA processing/ribosome biogenesis-domain-containing protein [Phellopilus nigrolimitatus]|nr:rRNA processing/ribosome biogenesis-domain-containing protein [Phellopilus nigrolimitatus]
MANTDLLQTYLQLHLANDAAAVYNLPSVLSSLSSQTLESSLHLTKWSNRVNALVHSKDPGARWAGIILALHTSMLSRSVLLSSGMGWVSTVLPMLSKSESPIVWKSSIRLIAYIFSTTTGLVEFQRQVVAPNVPKFSSALMSLAERQTDEELKILCLEVLSIIVSLYPTLHRPLASALSTFSLNFLNGSPTSTPFAIIESASKLHACLQATGGKVGGAALWRKSADETIAFCSAAVNALRTTYAAESQHSRSNTDPLVSVPLNLDRLRCGVELLCSLLRATVSRPVSVPIKSLVNLCVELTKVTEKGMLPADVDPTIRAIEASATSCIRELGCRLTGCLSRCVQRKLAPHLTRILTVITYQLEQENTSNQRLPFIKLIPTLFGSCFPPSDPFIAGRLVKVILPSIAGILSGKVSGEDPAASVDVGGKKGKKRARGYEGDEIFKVGRDVLCESALEGDMVLAALDALPYLLRVPNIPAYLQSLSSRLLLSLLVALPKLPALAISQSPSLKEEILRRVKRTCLEFAIGSSAVLCKSLPLVVDAITDDKGAYIFTSQETSCNTQIIDLMLHPRVPPVLRPLPSLDTVALTRAEESTDERMARENLGLCSMSDGMDVGTGMGDPDGSTSTSETQQHMQTLPDIPNKAVPPAVFPAAPVESAVPLAQPALFSPEPMPTATKAVAASTMVMESPIKQKQVAQPSGSSFSNRIQNQTAQATPPSSQVQDVQSRPSRPSDTVQMVVDDEEDDDIEIPTLNMESDTESETE